MNLQINLATRIYVDFRKVNLVIALLFVLVFTWLCIGIFVIVTNYEEIHRVKGHVSSLHAKDGGKKIPEDEYNRMLANIRNANGILEKRAYDWLSLLDNMESVAPAGISLTSLIPDTKGGQLKLSGTALNFAAVRKFVENLEMSNKFTEVFLTDQSTTKQGTQKGLTFSVTCKALP